MTTETATATVRTHASQAKNDKSVNSAFAFLLKEYTLEKIDIATNDANASLGISYTYPTVENLPMITHVKKDKRLLHSLQEGDCIQKITLFYNQAQPRDIVDYSTSSLKETNHKNVISELSKHLTEALQDRNVTTIKFQVYRWKHNHKTLVSFLRDDYAMLSAPLRLVCADLYDFEDSEDSEDSFKNSKNSNSFNAFESAYKIWKSS